MKLKYLFVLASSLTCLLTTSPSKIEAGYSLKAGRIVSVEYIATYSAQEHFSLGCNAIESCNWREALKQFRIVITNFPATSYGQEANYYEGVCYYNLLEYDYANECITNYLKSQSNPRYFQESIELKFNIADKLAKGAKRRFFGTKQLPKWACGKALALQVYDEVIAAVPSHEIAARALMAKGDLLWKLRDYRGCIEAFQLVIRRFPKHEFTPECYVNISRVFIDQCRIEFQNPDILAFAQINLRKFKQDFPREERICEAENNVQMIKEIYAQGLYDTGQFYERTCKPRASIIYYRNAIYQFPDTCVSDLCRNRLYLLDPTFEESPCTEDASTDGDTQTI
jgi:outer membrane protein assembly factor BamD (BamD/ComL family)